MNYKARQQLQTINYKLLLKLRTMTLNWGHKLILGFLVFAGMMIYLVYQSMDTRYDLVSKEYYNDELKYQQVIDGTNRANGLSSQVTVAQTGNDIIIRLPGEMN